MSNTLEHFQVSAGLAATIMDCAAKSGVDATPIAYACGLDPNMFGQVNKRLPIDGFCRLLEALSVLTQDPTFGLKAGAAFEKGASGVLGYGLMNAPTAGEGVEMLVEYLHKVDTATQYIVIKSDTELSIEWTYSPLLVNRDQYVDMALVILMAHFKELFGTDFDRVRCEMERSKPLQPKVFKELICNNIYFNCNTNACRFPLDALSRKNLDADPRLFSLLRMQIGDIANPLELNRDPTSVVRQYVATNLGKEPPTLAGAATEAGMSERTLQRRLTEEGTSLQEILDECRHELAEKLLQETDFSLSQISHQLGFSASSAFTRSAIRWFGESPSIYRQKLRAKLPES